MTPEHNEIQYALQRLYYEEGPLHNVLQYALQRLYYEVGLLYNVMQYAPHYKVGSRPSV